MGRFKNGLIWHKSHLSHFQKGLPMDLQLEIENLLTRTRTERQRVNNELKHLPRGTLLITYDDEAGGVNLPLIREQIKDIYHLA